MIKSELRFHGQAGLKYVYAKGAVVRGRHLSLKYAPNHRRKTDRIAVVVSRKVHKSAVVRNRIRRRVYELIRQQPAAGRPHDMVFLAYDAALATIDSRELTKIVRTLRQKAGLPITAGSHAIVNTKE